ncbi:MAG: HAD family hydrolase [Prevotella sp.]|nr:HAD family hydrolase [Prevotella sp.]
MSTLSFSPQTIRVVAFDADDTLWDCQSHFDRVEQECCRLLAPYAEPAAVSAGLFATERANMPLLGYGTKAFTISLVENALRISNYQLPARIVEQLILLGKELLRLPATPLDGVEPTLRRLQQSGRYRLVVFTKGELLDQESKLQRSGLGRYFSHVETVSDKGEAEFRQLCARMDVAPGELLMVGNSFRSDIAPALAIGAWAVHIPFSVVWELEKSEEYPHERLMKITHFSELEGILL